MMDKKTESEVLHYFYISNWWIFVLIRLKNHHNLLLKLINKQQL